MEEIKKMLEEQGRMDSANASSSSSTTTCQPLKAIVGHKGDGENEEKPAKKKKKKADGSEEKSKQQNDSVKEKKKPRTQRKPKEQKASSSSTTAGTTIQPYTQPIASKRKRSCSTSGENSSKTATCQSDQHQQKHD